MQLFDEIPVDDLKKLHKLIESLRNDEGFIKMIDEDDASIVKHIDECTMVESGIFQIYTSKLISIFARFSEYFDNFEHFQETLSECIENREKDDKDDNINNNNNIN